MNTQHDFNSSYFIKHILLLLLQYPEESVTMQQRIINRVEGDPHYRSYLNSNAPPIDNTATDAIIGGMFLLFFYAVLISLSSSFTNITLKNLFSLFFFLLIIQLHVKFLKPSMQKQSLPFR